MFPNLIAFECPAEPLSTLDDPSTLPTVKKKKKKKKRDRHAHSTPPIIIDESYAPSKDILKSTTLLDVEQNLVQL